MRTTLRAPLPAELVRELGLKAGDEIELHRTEAGLAVSRRPEPEDILADLRKFRGSLSASDRLTRDQANAR
ncbi:MAG TPA: AbrB/MazE/SpoVT family DNA-binding domain-containing protein [Paracoccus sp. (in: a-proteobacteria)]|nr:AbrB/MazE/SpoVT family DNA-binding domain-containing protein [Paracoccus sp. (in: a-proteobacteria)]